MALVIYGKTKCSLCGNIHLSAQDLIAVPPFISNESDRLYRFNDGAFHKCCLENTPEGRLLIKYIERSEEFQADWQEKVSQGEITDPDSVFGTGILSSDVNCPLEKYNFKYFIKGRVEKAEMRQLKKLILIEKEKRSISGNAINWILRKIDEFS